MRLKHNPNDLEINNVIHQLIVITLYYDTFYVIAPCKLSDVFELYFRSSTKCKRKFLFP